MFCIWDNFFHAMHNDPSTLSASNSHPHQLKTKEKGLVPSLPTAKAGS